MFDMFNSVMFCPDGGAAKKTRSKMEIVASHDQVSAPSVLPLFCIKCPSDDNTDGYSQIFDIQISNFHLYDDLKI